MFKIAFDWVLEHLNIFKLSKRFCTDMITYIDMKFHLDWHLYCITITSLPDSECTTVNVGKLRRKYADGKRKVKQEEVRNK
jgi:hypothetical protein